MKWTRYAAVVLFSAVVACSGGEDNGGGTSEDAIVSIAAIPGVTPPNRGEMPVSTITETAEYTGTVSWSPIVSGTFAGATVYTATITLQAKSGYTLTGVAENFFTVAGTTTAATNPAASGAVTAVFPPADWATYNLRDTGPAGGLIFYINPNAATDGWKYLECAPQSTEWIEKEWGKYGTLVGGTGTAIGTGLNNTTIIVAKLNESPAESDRAAQLADALTSGGYGDWFLPSRDELIEMCWVLNSRAWDGIVGENNPEYGTNRVGGFTGDLYWSSSEGSADNAWLLNFYNGYNGVNPKDPGLRVRAIRAF
jgi:hypothetical protein